MTYAEEFAFRQGIADALMLLMRVVAVVGYTEHTKEQVDEVLVEVLATVEELGEEKGFKEGVSAGIEEGYDEGYADGVRDARLDPKGADEALRAQIAAEEEGFIPQPNDDYLIIPASDHSHDFSNYGLTEEQFQKTEPKVQEPAPTLHLNAEGGPAEGWVATEPEAKQPEAK